MDENKQGLKNNILSDEEMKRLAILGESITDALSCNINGEGVPCKTDRLEAVELMKQYLKIHNINFTVDDDE